MTVVSSSRSDMPKLGVRSTRQRAAVVTILREMDSFASAKTIHNELISRGTKIGLTTVYRTLQSLSDIDAVDVLHMANNGETLYRHCASADHHHHLVCTECGQTEEIDGGPVESWAQRVSEEHGFTMSGHDANVFGLCPECHAKTDADGGEGPAS